MERRFKGLVAISDVLDDRYQKLSDKYHDLELSYNRKKKALQEIRDFLYDLPVAGGMFIPIYEICDLDLQRLLLLCDNALFSDGRDVIDGKTGIQHREKKITMRDVKARKK